jgi:hypothetical protein
MHGEKSDLPKKKFEYFETHFRINVLKKTKVFKKLEAKIFIRNIFLKDL